LCSSLFLSLLLLPFRRNPLFTGREDLLQQIHERFTAPNSGKTVALNQSQAINGLGGIGKTQTALEYAYRYRQKYRAVLWVSAASEEALQEDMIKLAGVLELGAPDQEPQWLIAAVKAWLTEQRDWLLILDNADDLAMAHSYLPEGEISNGHTLLTTRAQAGGPLIRMVPVEYMSQEEGTLLLWRRAKVLTPEETLEQASAKCRVEAKAIVAELGGLPLAIDQAGAYLEETGSILSSYLDLYRLRRKELLWRRSTLPSDHPEPVATTWSLSFRRVEKANAAADLLRLCAFLDPDAVPETMLIKGGAHLGPVLKPVMADPFALNQAIEELRKFSLVRRNANAGLLSLHRLVQVVLKDEMLKKAQRQWAKRAVLLVHAAFPRQEFAGWECRERCRLYLPHALACAALIETYHFTFEEAADLLCRTGRYLREQGLYAQPEPLFQQALAIEEQLGDAGQDLLAGTLNDLVYLYRDQGKYEQALPYGQRALAIREQISGPEHPEVATVLEGYAALLRDMHRDEEAAGLIKHAQDIRAKGRA
jgi:tetratricopeptide (TPR) repeat protein